MSIVNTGINLYRRFLNLLNFLQSPFLLLVRVYWGWQFWQAGWGKLQDISKPIGFFTELGIPFPVFNAWFVSLLECFGGILLILGLASRLISIPLVIDMVVAYIAADREALKSIFSEPDKFYAAAPYPKRLSPASLRAVVARVRRVVTDLSERRACRTLGQQHGLGAARA